MVIKKHVFNLFAPKEAIIYVISTLPNVLLIVHEYMLALHLCFVWHNSHGFFFRQKNPRHLINYSPFLLRVLSFMLSVSSKSINDR